MIHDVDIWYNNFYKNINMIEYSNESLKKFLKKIKFVK